MNENKGFKGYHFLTGFNCKVDRICGGSIFTYYGDPPLVMTEYLIHNICPVCKKRFRWGHMKDETTVGIKKIVKMYHSKDNECKAWIEVTGVAAGFVFRECDKGVGYYTGPGLRKLDKLYHPLRGSPKAHIYTGKCG